MAADKKRDSQRGMSDTVKVAIIGGIFVLLGAIVTGFCGLAPSLIPLFLRTDPTATATFTVSPTLAITDTHTPTPITPTETPRLTNILTATNTATSAPTLTNVPTQAPSATLVPTTTLPITRAYPCDGQIVSRSPSSTMLNIVRGGPFSRSSFRDPIQQGTAVIILAREQETQTIIWYQIADENNIVLGWVQEEYLVLSELCRE